jgi:hypothetical protein
MYDLKNNDKKLLFKDNALSVVIAADNLMSKKRIGLKDNTNVAILLDIYRIRII